MLPHCFNSITESGENRFLHPIPHIQVETVDPMSVDMHRIWKLPPIWGLAIDPEVHMYLIVRRALKGEDDFLVVVYENSFTILVDASVEFTGC